MAFPYQFLAGFGIKAVIVLLTIIVLILLDPRYVTAYISVNYEIVLIYIIASLTLLYCIVSVVMYVLMYRSSDDEDRFSLTNVSLAEIVFSAAGIIGWMLVCGIGGSVAQSTILETGDAFGWLAACAGINTVLFIGIGAVFALTIVQDKFTSGDRRYKYANASF
ncbi:Protein Y37D8A.16 [Aphelenchoides avenae]|nr:Protein Y37D8A.16 [Aphelenchus avenae]